MAPTPPLSKQKSLRNMNLSTSIPSLASLDKQVDIIDRRIDGCLGVLKTKLGNTPYWQEHLAVLQAERADLNNQIQSFNEYLKII